MSRADEDFGTRNVGPLRDVTALFDDNPDLLGSAARSGPHRFEQILATALAEAGMAEPVAVAQTLISASMGIKYQVATREEYRARIATAVTLLTRDAST
jgi:hypothetical protein